jgi:hypothetical protein
MRRDAIAAGLLAATLAMPAAAQQADPFAKIFDELRARWSAAQKGDQKSADACAAGPVPRMSFQPTTVYPDAIGVTASASGLVAIADLKQDRLLVYAGGLEQEPIKLALGGSYSPDAQQLSEDGRYLAFAAHARLYIMDLPAKKIVGSWQYDPGEMQWMGHDLLVGWQDIAHNQHGDILLRQTGEDFRVEPLPTLDDGPGKPPDAAYFARHATSDQLGHSFLRGDKLYADAAVAAADGAIPSAASSSWVGGTVYRSGDRLLDVRQKDVPFTGGPMNAPYVLTLHDGKTGAVIQARTLPDRCIPNAVAAMPDGGGFLMQVSGPMLQLLDSEDLHVKAVYRLLAPPLASPASISLLPGNRLLTATQLPYTDPSPVLLYNLSAPVPQ